MQFIPKVVYGAGPTTYSFLHPQKLWTPAARSVGGSNVSDSGVPESFILRRDQLVKLVLRFSEAEWADVDAWLTFAQTGASFDFYFDKNVVGNSFLWSEDFSNGVWTKASASVAAAPSILAPDGTTSTWRLIEGSGAGIFPRLQQILTGSTDNTIQTISFFARKAERTWCSLYYGKKDSVFVAASFNLSTGTWGTVVSSGVIRHDPVYYGNDWWRISISTDILSGGGTPVGQIRVQQSDSVGSITGDGVSGIYVWGGQWAKDVNKLEDYIQTTSAVNQHKYTCYLESPSAGDGEVTPNRESFTKLYSIAVILRLATPSSKFDVRIQP